MDGLTAVLYADPGHGGYHAGCQHLQYDAIDQLRICMVGLYHGPGHYVVYLLDNFGWWKRVMVQFADADGRFVDRYGQRRWRAYFFADDDQQDAESDCGNVSDLYRILSWRYG